MWLVFGPLIVHVFEIIPLCEKVPKKFGNPRLAVVQDPHNRVCPSSEFRSRSDWESA